MESELRIPADRARQAIDSARAVLVCAYDEQKCQRFMLEGAITAKQLEERLPSLAQDTDVLFYCA